MKIIWVQAIIDLPAAGFGDGAAFWAEVTNSRLGDVHPDHDEYTHLVPETGDMHLELQRLDMGGPSVHLDLLVDDIAGWTERAEGLGATIVATPGHSVLTTPGGAPFCIVPGTTESQTADVIDADLPHRVDQISIDVPHDSFDDDVAFWSALTGWDVNPPTFSEFRSFAQPDHLPLRLLIQQLGPDDPGPGRAHLDVSAGHHRQAVVERHIAAGARVTATFDHWTALNDPVGLTYCITDRQPAP